MTNQNFAIALTYRQKLQDPRWKALRTKIIAKRGKICQCCGTSAMSRTVDGAAVPVRYEVHHGYYAYWIEPWEYEEKTLWVLCDVCHDKVHDSLAILQRQIGLMDPVSLNAKAKDIDDEENRSYLAALHAAQDEALREAEEDRLQDQLERYQHIDVLIYSSNELGPSGYDDVSERLYSEFPGISISSCSSEPDCYWVVTAGHHAAAEDVEQVEEWLGSETNQWPV